jgi:hypothetical protein
MLVPLKDSKEKAAVQEIEQDEWSHRRNVLQIMQLYDIPVSRYYEIKYHLIGKVIGYSCYFIGRFMPYFFAGKLESGNVCEYFVMMRYFHLLGITEHDEMLTKWASKNRNMKCISWKSSETRGGCLFLKRSFHGEQIPA